MSDYLDRIIDEQNTQSNEPDRETPPQGEAELTPDQLTPPEGEAEQQAEVIAYTPEEVEELLKGDGQVDFRRLSPEGQAIWKSVDRGLKPKLEERSRLLDEVQQLRSYQPPTQPPPPPPNNIYGMFQQDPDGTLRQVKQALYNAKLKDPFSEEVTKLEMLRDDLTEKSMVMTRNAFNSQRAMDSAYSTVKSYIPDYETKREKLTEFAGGLGITKEELGFLTDPTVFGNLAPKLTLAINTLYDKMQVGDIKKKEVKKAINVEKAGGGFDTKKEADWGDNDYVAARQKSLLS